MAVNGIGSQSQYEMITGQKSNKKDSGNEFYNSLSDTMDEKTEELETRNKTNEPEKTTDNIDSKWNEALLKYYDFVEERVKNGAPKFQIGSLELSIDEWDKLLEKVDLNLDDIKEELEQRAEKMKDVKDKKADENSENNKIDVNSEKLILELLRDRTGKDITESDTESDNER